MSEAETPTPPPAADARPTQAEAGTSPSSADLPSANLPSANLPSANLPSANLDELRRKLREQFSGLGEQVDAMQSKLAADLAQATAQARAVIEKEIATVKEQYPDAFGRLHELRDVGEEGWGVLRTRLERLAGDLEKALGGFATALSDAVKNQSPGPAPTAPSTEGSPATGAPADGAGDSAAAPSDTDKPAASS